MIVGRLGSGTMSITNGGQSYNSGPQLTTAGNNDVFGAVIGSNFAADQRQCARQRRPGNRLRRRHRFQVDVAGNLQVGGFHDNRIGIGPLAQEDLEGNEASLRQRRRPRHAEGHQRRPGQHRPAAAGSRMRPMCPNRLDLLVGRFGRVELDGGRIELLGAFNTTNPQNPTQELTRGRLINDGVVTGDGSISVLQFRNRVLGEVRVDAGQTLVVEATGTTPSPTTSRSTPSQKNIPSPTTA